MIIADPDFPQERAVELVDLCHRRGVTVHVAPTTMEILFDRAEFVPGQSVPLFTLRPPVFEGIDYALKRTFDLVVSTVRLIVLAPVLLAIAIAVKLSSTGPAIYRSVRPGHGRQAVLLLQVPHDARARRPDPGRSGAAQRAERRAVQDPPRPPADEGRARSCGASRSTSCRSWSTWSAARCRWSGPRPLPMRDFERLEEWHKKRYLVLPGITGLWQVSGRSELDFDDLVRLDFLYLERWSVFLDLTILLKTIPAVLSRRGAF